MRALRSSTEGRCRTALLFVDVITHMDFEGGERLAEQAERCVAPLLSLRRAAHHAGCPVIYANDNYGQWSATWKQLVASCARGHNGGAFTRSLRPTERDLFVLKARNSAFYCTALQPLLESYGVKTLVLAGLTADNCVLFTAHDAYLRGLRVVVPHDAVASQTSEGTRRALEQVQTVLKARVCSAAQVRFLR